MSRRVIFPPLDFWTGAGTETSTNERETEMNEERDLSDGFPEYHRPPKDIVPNSAAEDGPPIPVGPATVVHYEITDDGITRTEENVFVGRAITRKDNSHE
ncbi:hypothetical protein FIV07_23780 [Mycobacterium sp. THAF192]|nr:hypothetical protein FIV07_23780 [Mycobacterium sp. THAF192]